jgi:hypothetical protein
VPPVLNWQIMRQIPYVVIALVLAACGSEGDSAAPPSTPDIAGAYQGEFTVRASSDVADQNLGSFPATATISQQKSGISIVLVPEQGGTFSFSGTVLTNGAITLEDEAGVSFLTLEMPQCDFTGAEVTSKATPSDGRLIVTADVSGAVCPWHEANGAFVPTAFAVRYEGTALE